MKQRTNQILYSYWNEVRGTRMAPRRFDVEPARIASILPETFILERNSTNVFRFRLAGTRICDYFGHELRHRNFLDLLPITDRATLEHDMETIAERGAVGLSEIETITRSRQSGRCEILVLPLTDPHNVVTRFLGAMSSYGVPDPFEASPITVRSLIRHELIWPDGRPHAVARHWPAPFQPKMNAPRIVKSHHRQFQVFDGGRSDSDPRDA